MPSVFVVFLLVFAGCCAGAAIALGVTAYANEKWKAEVFEIYIGQLNDALKKERARYNAELDKIKEACGIPKEES